MEMAEYIDRKEAIKAIESLPNCYNGFSDTYDKSCIIGVLEEVPATDVIPIKHGKWNWVGFNIECSECGAMPNFDSTESLYNFCPNCGADMRESENKNENKSGE